MPYGAIEGVCLGGIWPLVLIRGVPGIPPNASFLESSDKYIEELYDRHSAETISVLLVVS